MKNSRRTVIAAGTLFTAVALSGCSIADTMQNESSHEFESVTMMETDWNADAAWVPTDATDIRVHSSIDGEIAILAASTTADLDPALCTEVERRSGPVYGEEWAPNANVDAAWACGVWTVIPTDDGWFGWTPNDPDEQKASPADIPSSNAPADDSTTGAGANRG